MMRILQRLCYSNRRIENLPLARHKLGEAHSHHWSAASIKWLPKKPCFDGHFAQGGER
jgi:hypothetical protein